MSRASGGANQVAQSISQVADWAGNVSHNSEEAANGAAEVATNIKQVNEAVRNNSNDIAAITSHLTDVAGVAGQLRKIVGKFKLRDSPDSDGKGDTAQPPRDGLAELMRENLRAGQGQDSLGHQGQLPGQDRAEVD